MAERVDATGVPWGSVQWTMLCTLYLRAHEAGTEGSVLGDHAAAEAVRRIDYDFDRMRRHIRPGANQYLASLRARQFDLWAGDFLDRHPDAVVLHLGCGLDSRALRLAPPTGVEWVDVDVPQVIDLRRQVFPARDGYRMIGASVVDRDWLAEVPAGRPTLVLAEGLLPYLSRDEARDLLRRLDSELHPEELQFDALSPWAVRLSRIQHWGTRDAAADLREWCPGLRLRASASPMTLADWIPRPGYRRLYRALGRVPGLRDFSWMYRFTR